MNKRTLILIVGLIIFTSVLIMMAVSPKQLNQTINTTTVTPKKVTTPKQNVVADTILTFSPNPLTMTTNSSSVDINIKADKSEVTGAQLVLQYDPKILANVDITEAKNSTAFFKAPMVLLKKIDPVKGIVEFTVALTPSETAKSGAGSIATITFNKLYTTTGSTTITFLPGTLVTAFKKDTSVLKTSEPLTISFPLNGAALPGSNASPIQVPIPR